MANWPNVIIPETIPVVHNLEQFKTQFSSGYVQSRKRFTRSRKQWVLNWPVMPVADLNTIIAFFDTNIGGTFLWTSPVDAVEYEVRFSSGSFEYSPINADQTLYSMSIGFEEK